MEDKSGRFRKKKVNFSMVSNLIIRDDTISLKAKGLYCLIQSYITLDNFILYKDFLQSKCKEGRESFNSAWKELKSSGYLVQYKMRDNQTKKIYWEYELLDEVKPDTENLYMEKPCTGKPYDGSAVLWKNDSMENGGDINNIINSNIINNNTNHIISIDEVKNQIGYDAFRRIDQDQVSEIAMLITEVMNTADYKQIRIAKDNIFAAVVKERFRKLDKFHVEYVLECLRQNNSKISSMKNYLLTALYNAPLTMSSYYENRVCVGRE